MAESCRSAVLSSIWTSRPAIEHHLSLIAALLAKLPLPDQSAWLGRVTAIDARPDAFHDQLPATIASCDGGFPGPLPPVLQDIQAQLAEANQLRADLVDAVHAPTVQITSETAWTARNRNCPASSGATTGTPNARLISRPDLVDYYPPDAMRHKVVGRVRVYVEIDTTGCVTRTTIAQSSGAPELDQAGMLMGLDMQFMPGEVDGKAVAARFVQPMTFSMGTLQPRAAVAQPQP
jgi:TonB family protein